MSVQIIKQGDKPEWAVVPCETYLQLVEKTEMLKDVQDYCNVKAALEHGDDKLAPGMNIEGCLSKKPQKKIGVSVSHLSQLEKNKRKGSLDALTAIAKVLSIFPEHIVSSQA